MPRLPRLLILCLAILLPALPAQADDAWLAAGPDGEPRIRLYFFWSLTCPHCLTAQPHVDGLAAARPWIQLQAFELSRNPDHARLFQSIVERSGAPPEAVGVPAFLFCGEMHFGWESDATTGARLRAGLDACRARVLAGQPAAPALPAMQEEEVIDIPLFGAVDTAALSLPVLTLVLGGLDAFNPCAFFVLLFLLSMMAHQKSRARMLAVGGIFVTVSGLMYFAFMAAWLNVFQLVGHLAWITVAAGLLAVLVGAVNIKDFFWFEQGPSLSIPDSRKPDLFRRMRAILAAERLPAVVAATVLLAVAANFYELLCTTGFPMVYTRVLTLTDLSAASRYAYLALYNLIYVLPLAAIVIAFARTFGTRRLGEREGRLLKLLSGLMMLGLGGLLLVAPELLSRVGVAFALMAAALAITFIAARLTRPASR